MPLILAASFLTFAVCADSSSSRTLELNLVLHTGHSNNPTKNPDSPSDFSVFPKDTGQVLTAVATLVLQFGQILNAKPLFPSCSIIFLVVDSFRFCYNIFALSSSLFASTSYPHKPHIMGETVAEAAFN
jgi:hypothetical protein